MVVMKMELSLFERATQLLEIMCCQSSMREKWCIIRLGDMEKMLFSP